MVERFDLSERRGCRLMGMSRSSYRYEVYREDPPKLRERLKVLAEQRRRFGYRRLYVLLRREGFSVNHKRVYRLYRQEGLSLRRRRRKRLTSGLRTTLPTPQGPNQRWSMDFVSDFTAEGRRLKILTVVDDFTRYCMAVEVDTSIRGARVVQVLEQLSEEHGLPQVIVTDNGPEFTGKALDTWAYQHNLKLDFIRPGKPVENAFIESFNGKFRDECLNEHWFLDLKDAREKVAEWRDDYNMFRPHSSLGDLTPAEFLLHWSRKKVYPQGLTLPVVQ
jgi:putative transposase